MFRRVCHCFRIRRLIPLVMLAGAMAWPSWTAAQQQPDPGASSNQDAASRDEGADASSDDADNNTRDGEATGADQLELGVLLNPEIESSSLIVEPVSEAPAPVTVVTSDMIDSIGARNLQEVLTTFVPGISEITDKNELNVAMRGIYTTSQQKILILVNGHRINSRTFSSAPPDFSIGIAPSKIKQIEIVRGPGSAVYGNLALNGVVNIVTKRPEEVSSVDVELGIGNYGQQRADVTYGERFDDDHSLTLWGSFFRSDGRTVTVPDSEQFNEVEDSSPEAHLMGFKDPASFDVGGEYHFGDFTLFGTARQGKWVPPFSSGAAKGGQTYDYEAYQAWNGVKPGLLTSSTHAELKYDTSLGDHWSFKSSVYLDTNRTQQRLVVNPERSGGQIEKVNTAIGWSEWSVGNLTQLTLKYDWGPAGRGNLAFGGQVDHMKVVDSYWLTGSDGRLRSLNLGNSEDATVIPHGNETIYSGFSQLKHKFGYNGDIIANLGVRYDYKDRHEYQYVDENREIDKQVGDDVDAISPRTALIIGPESWLGVKFSYSESFVDAPYFQRNTNYRLRNFRGSPTLEPETMRAFQLTPTLRVLDERLRNSLNFYYIEHRNIIFRDPEATRSEPLFKNTGQLNVAGVENQLAFIETDYRIRANATFQRPVRSEVYPVTDKALDNVPTFFGNLTLDAKPLWTLTDDLWLSLSGRYYGQQRSPVDITYITSQTRTGGQAETKEFKQPNRTVDDYLLLRSSLRWEKMFDSNFRLQFTVNNILDTTYYQGGTTSHPYRQPGRWFLLQLGYNRSL